MCWGVGGVWKLMEKYCKEVFWGVGESVEKCEERCRGMGKCGRKFWERCEGRAWGCGGR